LKQLLIARTEGNPFFLEESIRTLVETKFLIGERGSYRLERTLASTQVPATVQAVLAARIDRLPPDEKRLLQSAAVIGKDVRLGLLQAIADQSEEEISRGLIRLQAAEFLYETSLFPEVEYTFKHALTHEVAYGSVLQDRRRVLHGRIVESIERLYPDRLAEQFELLAHHASRAELWEKAVTYLYDAGRKATARSAYKEAASYFDQSLDALKRLPESRQTLELAINIRVDLGPILIAMKGFIAPEVEQVYTEAREICGRFGDTPQLFPVLFGLARMHDVRGELKIGSDLGKQLLSLAERAREPALLLEAHHELWANMSMLGELISARTHLDQGFVLYDSEKHRHHAFLYGGHDPGVCCRYHAAHVLWLLGYPDQALRKSQDSLTLARELSHASTTATALSFAIWLDQQRGESDVMRAHVDETITIATEHGFPRWLPYGNFLQGWLLVEKDERAGIAQMVKVFASQRATAAQGRFEALCAALLAEAYRRIGQTAEALNVITDALTRAHQTECRYYEAELYRLKGELLLTLSAADEQQAEACFQIALKVARGQSARSLELRAAMSLCRLWQRQGKTAEARQLLAEIYGWFTEGFDTADLKEAKALLEELA
jgi:adenylate cyclase